MTPVDYIVLGAVALLVGVAVYFSFRRRRRGGGCCGCCSSCTGCSSTKRTK